MVTQETVDNLCAVEMHLRKALTIAKLFPNEEHLSIIFLLLGHLLAFVEERGHIVATRVMYQDSTD